MRVLGLAGAVVFLTVPCLAMPARGAVDGPVSTRSAALAAAPTPRPSASRAASPKPSARPSKSKRPSAPQVPVQPQSCDLPRGYRGSVPASWAQKRLAFQRAWQLTRGGGVTVAVIDSGADTRHPMLAGRVQQYVDLTRTGKRDCAGHGTGVAALIGGRDLGERGVPLSGVAPASQLLIIKQQNADHDEQGGDRLPNAIRKAADAGARVINVSIAARHSPALERAVTYAQSRNAVIVAAAGNARKRDGGDDPAYPANYPGVISVASLGIDGGRVDTSQLQSRVDVGAPGKDVFVPWPGGGYHLQAEGTSYAAAFVSGVAALVRARHPDLGQAQVVRRIIATADGNVGAGTGHGMVNPGQAVTAVIPGEDASAPTGSQRPLRSVELAAPAPADARTRGIAVAVAAATVGLALVAALGGVVVPLGRRRGWRAGKADPAARRDEEESVVTGTEGGTIGVRG